MHCLAFTTKDLVSNGDPTFSSRVWPFSSSLCKSGLGRVPKKWSFATFHPPLWRLLLPKSEELVGSAGSILSISS